MEEKEKFNDSVNERRKGYGRVSSEKKIQKRKKMQEKYGIILTQNERQKENEKR